MCNGGVCVSPPAMSPNSLLGSHLVSTMDNASPEPRASKSSTLTGVVLDHDWSGRTFNIPDCPSKHSVGSLKGWYQRNICPSAQLDALQIVRQDSGSLVDDETPFWQLAEGEGVFFVSILHAHPSSPHETQPAVRLLVQHDCTGMSTQVTLPAKSTLMQLKIVVFEQLGLGDAAAALDPRVGFTSQGVRLDNEATIHSTNLNSGDFLVIGERHSTPSARRVSRTPSPTRQEDRQYHKIAGIWASEQAELNKQSCSLVEEGPKNTARRRRGPQTNKQSSKPKRVDSELEKMRLSYRTKMCRSGGNSCKFGTSCWFAHTKDELRKPTDPLPAHCPGVNKLEKYARRQEN